MKPKLTIDPPNAQIATSSSSPAATAAVNNSGVGTPSSSKQKGRPQCLTITVLGASGDLARKKTYPALFSLWKAGHVPFNTKILGYARSKLQLEEFKSKIRSFLKDSSSEKIEQFLSICDYVQGEYSTMEEGPPCFSGLNEVIDRLEREVEVNWKENAFINPTSLASSAENKKYKRVVGNRIFYLALPPVVYPSVCAEIKACVMSSTSGSWTRVVVEKPFGKDLESSEKLNQSLSALFSEEQLYRIDHYLGKELVQNLVVMRFANRFISPLWNRDNIANVQIIFKEPFGTEGRGGYFDDYGIIRDVIQNHLLQIMCLVAMEKPCSLSPDDIRDEKLKVLRCIAPVSTDNVVVGQYSTGPHGQPAYVDDPGVPENSTAPTFCTCVMYVKNERWDGVPFIIKAGKALNEAKCEIRVQFKDVPGDLFESRRGQGKQARNEFVVRLQPDPTIFMKMTVKEPGLDMNLAQSELELLYTTRYQRVLIPEAYERLILDCINGDQQHFVRRDELVAAWTIFTPLLKYIDAGGMKPYSYPYGSVGPYEANALRERVGHQTNVIGRDITWEKHGLGSQEY